MELTIAQILEATGGRLAQGGRGATALGVTTDSRRVKAGDLFVALPGERFDGHEFVAAAFQGGAVAAIVEHVPDGLPAGRPLVLVDDTAAAYGALAAWWRQRVPARVVGITGSNGKTTTKEITAQVLGGPGPTVFSEANHNNQIGVPETLLRLRRDHRFAVVEMGTNHFGELPALARLVRPDVALITNVGPTHLEAFGSEEGVAREKGTLLEHLAPGGLAVLHADDPWSRGLAERHPGRTVTFGFAADADWRASAVELGDTEVSFVVAHTGDRVTAPLVGRWQVANCLAALAVASEMGLSVPEAAERLKQVTLPPWRMSVRRAGGLTLLIDCYNANLASMRCALGELARRECAGRRVAVLGDMRELGQASPAAHREAGGMAADAGAELLCAVGQESFVLVGEALSHGLLPTNVFWTTDREAAVQWLCRRLRPADIVLFKGSRGMRLEEVADAVAAWAESGIADAMQAAGEPRRAAPGRAAAVEGSHWGRTR